MLKKHKKYSLEKKELECNEQKSVINNLRSELLTALQTIESLKATLTEKSAEIDE